MVGMRVHTGGCGGEREGEELVMEEREFCTR